MFLGLHMLGFDFDVLMLANFRTYFMRMGAVQVMIQ